jgi:oligoribonuclease NrnB/cAMP/cGMP phosphodiesterase (DHH superfamily)
MKLFHLSHNDLDGYGSQLVTAKAAEMNVLNVDEIVYFNTNYGKEIDQNFELILKDIKSFDSLLITDINLSEDQASFINEKQKEIGFDLMLLDHHETGKNNTIYPWYYLDTTKCGTKITYEKFFKEDLDLDLYNIVEIINVYDLWKENSELFQKGKSLNQVLYKNKDLFPKVLTEESLKLNLFMIYNYGKILLKENFILFAENEIFILEVKYFSQNLENFKELNIPLHSIKVIFMYEKIMERKDLYKKIEIDGMKAEIFYSLSNIFQEFSQLRLLDKNREKVDFVANINTQGYIGFRSKAPVKVNDFSKKYFNGGGHPQAAGGSLDKKENKIEETELIPLFIEQLNSKIFN